jgi:hypothetical protein
MSVPQLSKPFIFSTWTRVGLFCPKWSGFDHATLAPLFPPFPARVKEAIAASWIQRRRASRAAARAGCSGGARARCGSGTRAAQQHASRLRQPSPPCAPTKLTMAIAMAARCSLDATKPNECHRHFCQALMQMAHLVAGTVSRCSTMAKASLVTPI